MAIQGIITNIGLSQSEAAANNQGFYIQPTKFSVSNVLSALDPNRTAPNSGVFYTAPISSGNVISYNTIQLICTIPPDQIPLNTFQTIKELYIFGTLNSVDFLFAIGQPNPNIIYDPTGSVTIEMNISLTNVDLSSIITFDFTQATEVAEHDANLDAHPDLVEAVNKAGIFYDLGGGPTAFAYRGQSFDENVVFDGTPATATRGGVTFTAQWNGPAGNSIILPFDGTSTTDQICLAWNNANPFNPVINGGTGSEILAAGGLQLQNGTLLVNDKDPVYKDTDGVYKQAFAEASIRALVAGFADMSCENPRIVRSQGFFAKTTGFPVGSKIYLDNVTPGNVTTVPTGVEVGIQIDSQKILIGNSFGSQASQGDEFDAIVSTSVGVGFYPTTQQAITATPDGGRILVDILEVIDATLDTQNKRIDFWFNGPSYGWTRYLGTSDTQLISFSQVPTSGTFRIEFNGQATVDLPFNATASQVQTAMNNLTATGIPCTVTGNFTSGFTITFSPYLAVPQVTFLNPGQDCIQTISFSTTPNNGTFEVSYNGNDSDHIAWNNTNSEIQTQLEAIPGLTSCNVTGSWGSNQFQVEFTGASGLQPQSQFLLVNNSLKQNATNVNVTLATSQVGMYPASNLMAGSSPVTITPSTLVEGTPIGPTTCINVTKDYTRFIGLGLLQNWPVGINLNGHIGVDVEMEMSGNTLSIEANGLKPRRDYHRDKSFGMIDPVEIYVGPNGDYLDLWSAIAIANPGDKIIVAVDQTLTNNQVIDIPVEIEFINNASIIVTEFVGGSVITFGDGARTRNCNVILSASGNYSAVFDFTGDLSHHSNLMLNCGNGAVNVTNAFQLDNSATRVFVDGALQRSGASVMNVIAISGGFGSNNLFIRDLDLDIVENTISDTSVAEQVVATEGQTVVTFQTILFNPANTRWDLDAYRDGINVFQDDTGGLNKDYRKISENQIEFAYPLLDGELVVGKVEKNNVVALGTQAYFVSYLTGVTGTNISTVNNYNVGTDKLSVYRNGIYEDKSGSLGAPADQYSESGAMAVTFAFAIQSQEWIGYVNEDNTPTRIQVTGQSGTVLTVPTYSLGSNRLRVYRNGMLMNTAGIGGSADQYTETSPSSITLNLAATSSEVFTYYVMALIPVYRQDLTGLSGTVITVPAYTVGDQRLLVYRNGLLMANSLAVGSASEQYQETDSTQLTFQSAFTSGETLTLIYK